MEPLTTHFHQDTVTLVTNFHTCHLMALLLTCQWAHVCLWTKKLCMHLLMNEAVEGEPFQRPRWNVSNNTDTLKLLYDSGHCLYLFWASFQGWILFSFTFWLNRANGSFVIHCTPGKACLTCCPLVEGRGFWGNAHTGSVTLFTLVQYICAIREWWVGETVHSF